VVFKSTTFVFLRPAGYLRTMSEYSLGDAMKQFLNKSRIKGSIQAIQIEEVWEQLMGKTIAKYTEKIQIHGQTLYITTHMAPLKQELLFQKENIIARVNEALGEKTIREVVIV
jgi:predicted nucleic acid-binding Zn ribbon protein